MSTNEQRSAREKFMALTTGYTVATDAEGWPTIPGKYGRIEWYCDGEDCHSCPHPGQFALAVYTDRRLVRGRVLAIPGVRRHQTGDEELRAVFLPEALLAVARVIRARKKYRASSAQLANLVPSPRGKRPPRRAALVPAGHQGKHP